MKQNLDKKSISELIELYWINQKDIIEKLMNKNDILEKIINLSVNAIKHNGRVIYIGAGTSGRIGMLDALDILPTFGEKNWFIYQMAGSDEAILKSLEGYEDDFELGAKDAIKLKINQNDLLIGLSVSGNTKYVNGFFSVGTERKSKKVLITENKDGLISPNSDIVYEFESNPEFIQGSTRLKAGTIQKILLNAISTITAIKLNKVYDDLMIDLTPINEKLVQRSIEIVKQITNADFEIAKNTYLEVKNVKVACVMIAKKVDKIKASELLVKYNNNLREVLEC
ncbi:N-acetylmuramic acid 6-phosphate etherase [Mycoplasmopsis anatis]|uniref:N-acetylmuramic acid-6-phosphate etherase n=1 Tax=Mycoplasmopsis anatis 1340 TaxID=1034808 RepID=F9QDP5_9BACT|nr:N-acetylmuramic acid 6-phosphate etherase [Mycoplasmopsis anatis]AWX69927.1 N-acetylmuramic acid 6-phosphate etherase [Mycoplasmopsis anatis]EGS29072.1 N-acetylmuramic acid-6-phosphate etherase [Mycoplasmopsis anatis 1340]VEU73646.1 N-acetylmuramic acid 6-phosphate etherase [Mycoplasmopsis anatis]